MAFDSRQRDFGILKVDGRNVKVYSTNSAWMNIAVGKDIKDARWNGDEILVYLMDGKIRRYSSLSAYTTI